MRALVPPADTLAILAHVEAAPGFSRVRALTESFAAATPDTVAAIVEEAERFAQAHLAPLNAAMDSGGCSLADGRVRTAPGHREAWKAYVEAGWSTLDRPEDQGGQGLPLAVAATVQELFDRVCPAFGMLPVPQRAAARLIAAWGDAALQAEWLGPLASGAWGATICISEPGAGSDVGRVRTRAVPEADGTWRITGEKCWISYGDHDLAPRIGHCLLARTPDAAPGGAGLSLFLVPDTVVGADGAVSRNAIVVRRIEDKLGLHGSPTCALGFEGAVGRLIGAQGRGLAQMFVMITAMRLSVGVQGLGIASGCADVALAYAMDRRQGGQGAEPMRIVDHPDVQRQLMEAVARVDVFRGLALALANQADLAQHETDAEAKADAAGLVQWLLPIVKTTGGDYAFEVAGIAMQVLGGAGYTADWPVEQAMRDARVLTIFEGTTGMQALDLVNRRLLRGDRRGLSVFLAAARAAATGCPAPEGPSLSACLDRLETAAAWLRERTATPRETDATATAFLHLAALAATGWIAAGFVTLPPDSPAHRKLGAAGRYWLAHVAGRAATLHAEITAGSAPLDAFADICSVRPG